MKKQIQQIIATKSNIFKIEHFQVDEELLKRSIDSDSDPGTGSSGLSANSAARKTWTATRRSFFKRRKGGRSSSRDSSAAKELASFSDMASLNYAEAGSTQALHEVEPSINSYVRVERLDCKHGFYQKSFSTFPQNYLVVKPIFGQIPPSYFKVMEY